MASSFIIPLYRCIGGACMRRFSSVRIASSFSLQQPPPPTEAVLSSVRCFSKKKRASEGNTVNNDNAKYQEEVRRQLEKVNEWLEQADEEPWGRHRGITQVRTKLKQQAVGKQVINNRVASDKVNSLIYRRHALQHGKLNLNDMMRSNTLTESFLGPQPKRKPIQVSVDMAKTFLKELWRYGESQQLNHLREQVELKRQNKLRHDELVAAAKERKKEEKKMSSTKKRKALPDR